jgi:hypothetical protein
MIDASSMPDPRPSDDRLMVGLVVVMNKVLPQKGCAAMSGCSDRRGL